jgi:hypothetical protein
MACLAAPIRPWSHATPISSSTFFLYSQFNGDGDIRQRILFDCEVETWCEDERHSISFDGDDNQYFSVAGGILVGETLPYVIDPRYIDYLNLGRDWS